MKLMEFMDQQDLETALYDPSADQVGVRVPNDQRKTRLTLAHLNRLKRTRALHRLETIKQEDLWGIMYGIPDEEGGGMGGMPGMGGGPAPF